VVREAHGAGISRVWMQEGAESETALQLCEELGIAAVHGVCVILRSR
jgi:predicted CoA-binding protein